MDGRQKKWKHPDWRVRWAQRLRPRWRVADAVNRSERYCWAELVDWVLQTEQRRKDIGWYRRQGWGWWEARRDARKPLLSQAGGIRCQVESSICGSCYCGKFRNGCLAAPLAAVGVPADQERNEQ